MPKFISENAASKATPAKVIRYVLNEEKCCRDENGEMMVSTIGLDDDRPYSKQFREIAELNGNDYGSDDRKYYHFKITVSPDAYDPDGAKKITPAELHGEAERLVLEKFEGYQALLATQYHNNGEQGERANDSHLHVHVVVNASSYEGKNKIDLSPQDLDDLRDYAYEMGLKYELEEGYWRDEVEAKLDRKAIENANETANKEPVRVTDEERKFQRTHGKNFVDHSWKEQYRIAIDEAKAETGSREGFQMYLKEHFNIDTKITAQGHIKYKSPDRRTYSDGRSLGTDYELPAVDEALARNQGKLQIEFDTAIKEERDNYPTPTLAEQQVAEFYEAFNKFKEWRDTDYAKQREDWLKETDKKKADEKEYYLNRTVLENGQAAFYAAIEKLANETRVKAETESYKEEMRALQDHAAAVEKQQAEILYIMRARAEAEESEKRRLSSPEAAKERDREREAYVAALIEVGNSLDEKIRAAEAIRDMNIEDGRVKDYQSQAQDIYGRDSRTMRSSDEEFRSSNAIVTRVPRKIQAMADSLTLSRELGANTAAEFQLFVNKKGRELGDIRKELRRAQADGDEEKVEKLQEQEAKLRKEYSRYARAYEAKKEMEDDFYRYGGLAGLEKKWDSERAQQLEEKEIPYLERRIEYLKKQAKTLNSICANMKLSLGDVIFESERAEQYGDFLRRRDDAYRDLWNAKDDLKRAKTELKNLRKKAEEENSPKTPEKKRRSKEEAIKETNEQKAELRDWIDDAKEKIGSTPGQSREADMKAFVEEMQKHGCTVRVTENTVSVKHPNSNQAIRTNRLGENYTKGAIENGISIQREQNRASEQNRSTPARSRGGRELAPPR